MRVPRWPWRRIGWRRASIAGAVLLALVVWWQWPALTPGNPARWRAEMAAGKAASATGHFTDLPNAERAYRAAVREARHFSCSSPRLIASLLALAAVEEEMGMKPDYVDMVDMHHPHTPLRALWHATLDMLSQWNAYSTDQAWNTYESVWHYSRADRYYREAWVVAMRRYGPNSAQSFDVLHKRVAFYGSWGQWTQWHATLQRQVSIGERCYGRDGEPLSEPLASLADYYDLAEQPVRAEAYALRALTIQEKAWGQSDIHLRRWLFQLANLYQRQHNYPAAESYLLRTTAIVCRKYGRASNAHYRLLDRFCRLYAESGETAKEIACREQMVAICRSNPVRFYIEIESTLGQLSSLYSRTRQSARIEPLLTWWVATARHTFAPNIITRSEAIKLLATYYGSTSRYPEGERLYQDELASIEATCGLISRDVTQELKQYADFCRKNGHLADATALEARARAIERLISTRAKP